MFRNVDCSVQQQQWKTSQFRKTENAHVKHNQVICTKAVQKSKISKQSVGFLLILPSDSEYIEVPGTVWLKNYSQKTNCLLLCQFWGQKLLNTLKETTTKTLFEIPKLLACKTLLSMTVKNMTILISATKLDSGHDYYMPQG